jgi:hypothetical protein
MCDTTYEANVYQITAMTMCSVSLITYKVAMYMTYHLSSKYVHHLLPIKYLHLPFIAYTVCVSLETYQVFRSLCVVYCLSTDYVYYLLPSRNFIYNYLISDSLPLTVYQLIMRIASCITSRHVSCC